LRAIEVDIVHIREIKPARLNETTMADDSTVKFGFVCVQNAGRSQMSTAFAERERERRGLEESVEIITGGTLPADSVHEEVVTVMSELDIDLSDRTPREVSTAELESCDVALR